VWLRGDRDRAERWRNYLAQLRVSLALRLTAVRGGLARRRPPQVRSSDRHRTQGALCNCPPRYRSDQDAHVYSGKEKEVSPRKRGPASNFGSTVPACAPLTTRFCGSFTIISEIAAALLTALAARLRSPLRIFLEVAAALLSALAARL
jgi:hypothetical protein